jgi:hypothetical protein
MQVDPLVMDGERFAHSMDMGAFVDWLTESSSEDYICGELLTPPGKFETVVG